MDIETKQGISIDLKSSEELGVILSQQYQQLIQAQNNIAVIITEFEKRLKKQGEN